jgi:lipid-A-disaccharide synthase-like uncharacterized protein
MSASYLSYEEWCVGAVRRYGISDTDTEKSCDDFDDFGQSDDRRSAVRIPHYSSAGDMLLLLQSCSPIALDFSVSFQKFLCNAFHKIAIMNSSGRRFRRDLTWRLTDCIALTLYAFGFFVHWRVMQNHASRCIKASHTFFSFSGSQMNEHLSVYRLRSTSDQMSVDEVAIQI